MDDLEVAAAAAAAAMDMNVASSSDDTDSSEDEEVILLLVYHEIVLAFNAKFAMRTKQTQTQSRLIRMKAVKRHQAVGMSHLYRMKYTITACG